MVQLNSHDKDSEIHNLMWHQCRAKVEASKFQLNLLSTSKFMYILQPFCCCLIQGNSCGLGFHALGYVPIVLYAKSELLTASMNNAESK
jgi:hypothetical protein